MNLLLEQLADDAAQKVIKSLFGDGINEDMEAWKKRLGKKALGLGISESELMEQVVATLEKKYKKEIFESASPGQRDRMTLGVIEEILDRRQGKLLVENVSEERRQDRMNQTEKDRIITEAADKLVAELFGAKATGKKITEQLPSVPQGKPLTEAEAEIFKKNLRENSKEGRCLLVQEELERVRPGAILAATYDDGCFFKSEGVLYGVHYLLKDGKISLGKPKRVPPQLTEEQFYDAHIAGIDYDFTPPAPVEIPGESVINEAQLTPEQRRDREVLGRHYYGHHSV